MLSSRVHNDMPTYQAAVALDADTFYMTFTYAGASEKDGVPVLNVIDQGNVQLQLYLQGTNADIQDLFQHIEEVAACCHRLKTLKESK